MLTIRILPRSVVKQVAVRGVLIIMCKEAPMRLAPPAKIPVVAVAEVVGAVEVAL